MRGSLMLKRNLFANVAGTAWNGLLTFLLIPVYVRLLGVEAYGLIALQATLQTLVLLFDFGLSTAVNRELAALSARGAEEARAVLRAAERLTWAAAIVIAVLLIGGAPVIATRWLTAVSLPHDVVVLSLRWLGAAVALLFPWTLYSNAMLGIERAVVMNAILTASVTVRAIGSVAIIATSRDLVLFFVWQAIVSFAQTASAVVVLHRRFRGTPVVGSGLEPLRRTWSFVAGLAIVTVLAAIETQVDKLTVTKLLPLTAFGTYSLAASLAAVLPMLAQPIGASVFPRFTRLATSGSESEILAAYRYAVQAAVVLLVPIASVLAGYAPELVLLWTGDAMLAAAAGRVMPFLVAGSLLNALINVPYMLQLAHRWTRPAIIANVGAILFLVPVAPLVVSRWKTLGAAAVWLATNAGLFVYGLVQTHRRLLPRRSAAAALGDVAGPIVISLLVVLAGRAILPHESRIGMFVTIAIVSALTLTGAAAATPAVREWVAILWNRYRADGVQ